MKKKPAARSAFFNPRVLIGLAFCSIALLLTLLAFSLYPGGNALAQGPGQDQATIQALAQENSQQETDAPEVIGTCDTAGPVEVEATAGTLGPTAYPDLASAIAAINAGTHQGVINIEICGSTIETGTMFLNGNTAAPANYTSVTIRPLADGLTISGPTLTGRGLIELNGASNITIDGDNPNTIGINRNLTIQNTAANTVTFTSVIRVALATTVVTTANNNTFKNLNIVGSSAGRNISSATSTSASENTTFGIFAGPGASTVSPTTAPSAITSVSTSVGAGATATNLTITNNNCSGSMARAISMNGSATTVFPGLLINNNVIGNATAGSVDQVTSIGITVQGSTDAVIRSNTVYVEGYVGSSSANHGIEVGVNSSSVSGVTIEKNKISRSRNNNGGTWSAYGINLGGGNNHVVRNNFVFDVRNDQTAGTGGFSFSFGAFGIRVGSGTGHKVYHNSVHLFGVLPGAVSSDLVAAFGLTATGLTGVDVRNNIFSNIMTGGNPTQTNTRLVAVALPSAGTSAMALTWNNNDYVEGADANSRMAQVGTTAGTGEYTAANFDPTMVTPATNFRAYTSTLSAAGTNDNASKKIDPLFTSNTDLHISFASPMVDMGVDVGVTDDIDGNPRPNGADPEIGADELPGGATPTATATATASPSPTSTATSTATATATATIASTATPTPGCENYVISNASDTIVPGTTDISNHCDDCTTAISLPFPINLYGNTYTTANVGSNGFLNLSGILSNSFYTGCLPNSGFSFTIFPFEIDQTTAAPGKGIFTLTTGTAPNRTFYIEWRNCRYSTATTCLANSDNNYEIVFQEGSTDFSIIYGTFGSANTIAGSGAIGVQGISTSVFTQSQCGNGAPAATKQIYTQCLLGTPSPTPTATATVPITPTPTPTPCLNYNYNVMSGAIVPGTVDTGNHADDSSTVIALPFNYQLYEQTFTNVAVGSNGHLTFGTVVDSFNPGCIPIAGATYAIFPYETDQCTFAGCLSNTGTGYGIFTSVSGTAPNRIFNVEYRTAYYNSGATAPTLNYEVRLYEGLTEFDVIYGTVPPTFTPPSARILSVGVQRTNTTGFTLVGCDTTGGGSPPVSAGQLYHYTLGIICSSPTPTATATSTATATATASPTPTATATATIAPTPTPTSTPTPPCPNPTTIFLENFDGVTVPALPAGWTATNAVNPDSVFWVTSNSGAPTPSADSLPNAAFVNDPGAISDKRLDSPTIAIVGPAQLSFRSNYNLEPGFTTGTGFDGGVLEISIGGGGFTDITTAGGTFINGGYNATISTEFSSPIAGRMAWSGNSLGFVTTVANLPAAANGQNINLRWRMASDSSVSKDGWRIDTVSILDCLPAGTPTPTPTPTPATISISGNILLCNATTGAAMQNVTMTMTGSNSGTTLTDVSGNYTLSGVTNSGTTTVTPTKPQRAQGSAGINTTDAVAIQRHFLVIGTPLSGCHLTAADVNGTGTVNTVDAVAVQRFFLIQGTGTANVGKYVFSPVNRVYAMPLGGNQTGQNYTAVCLGDVVATFVPGNPRPELPPGE